MSDLLLEAAIVWQRLMAYEYRVTAARNKQAHNLRLCFSAADFYHLAGFHYLKDISGLPKIAQVKYLDAICRGMVTHEQVSCGTQYTKLVAPRLQALVALDSALDGDFAIYRFYPERLPFHSQITGAYLVQGDAFGEIQLLFVDRQPMQEATCFCRSAFVLDPERDYRANQPRLTMLYKAKAHLPTGEVRVLFQK